MTRSTGTQELMVDRCHPYATNQSMLQVIGIFLAEKGSNTNKLCSILCC
jgi:hypothetical protein